ncbi:hypothetical protein [uncultured Delftia sp.]|jgi:hypothetical protein|uniref:hypothetical protein n=1 Tax=uncultured Delftia sp. TaxID=191464 RepID=UPI002594345A|nr:hypothetical protein [uncultured Delftia sp.]
MSIRELFDGLSAQWERERADTQMTLGKLIAALEGMPPNKKIQRLGEAHSYRGYYSDLAFETSPDQQKTAKETLKIVRGCMGKVFKGYKGGDFPMHSNSPVWIAGYGCCGVKIVGINEDGSFETAQDA